MGAVIQNLGTALVCVALILAVVGIILVMRRDKRRGKSSCGGSCGSCPMSDSCHVSHNSGEQK